MKPTSVSVSVRYSRPLPDGSYKTVELTTEASLTNSEERWQDAQMHLYRELGETIKQMFGTASANGKKAQAPAEPAPTPPAPAPEHWCSVHKTNYQKFSKDGKVWWSHKAADGWCKEK